MKRTIPFTLLLMLFLTGCLDGLYESEREKINSLPRDLTPAEQQVIESDKQFGVDLFRNLSAREDGNIFISPLSISMSLGMTVNGAAGETREGMKEALRKSGLNMQEINDSYRGLLDILPDLDPGVKLQIANAIWYRDTVTLREPFMSDTRQYFDAEVRGLDFDDPASVGVINGWVDEQTEGLIPTIIEPPIPGDILNYLMNAVYFKGNWTTAFDPDDTRPGTFTTADGREIEVDMMERSRPEEQVATYWSEEALIADIAYGDSLFSMTLIMPTGDHSSLDEFIEEEFTVENLEEWIDGLSGRDKLRMPKFELEYEVGLDEVLSSMGMEIAFSSAADFSNMFENTGGWIDTVQHKTYIKVDEVGTEAAAVTNTAITSSGPLSFDRPFIYLIRERLSGTIIFIGRMNDPTAD